MATKKDIEMARKHFIKETGWEEQVKPMKRNLGEQLEYLNQKYKKRF